MNIRRETVYVTDKVIFYAHILVKAKCHGTTQGDMKIDQLIDAELIDKWEHEYPQLVQAYEINCEIKQGNKKRYDEAEQEILRLIAPVPGGKIQNDKDL